MTRPDAASSEMVGPYRVIKAIGGGGSARIDLARIERAYGFERDVVLKRPLEHLRSSPTVASSLRREASLGGRLRHPNIVAVLDAGQHDGYDYLVLEYIRGLSLRAATEATPGTVAMLPLDAALSIVIGVASGLEFAHELLGADNQPLGLVHRDVSPANVLIGIDGTVKLADFGIAKDTHVDTLSGSLRGTVTYMAPEQCRGHAFDRRADVFSLGVILHELITGRRLFWADNDVASLHRVLSGAIPDPRELVPSIPPELAEIAMHALAHDASDRIPRAKDLAELLETFATQAGVLIGARRIERAVHTAIEPSPTSSLSGRLTDKRFTAAITAARSIAEPIPTKPMRPLPPAMRPSIEEPSLVTVIESVSDLDDLTEPSGEPAMLAPSAPQNPAHAIERFTEPTLTASHGRTMQASHPAPPSIGRRGWRALAIVFGLSITLGVTIAILAMQRTSRPDTPRVIAPAPSTATPRALEPGPEPTIPVPPTIPAIEPTPAATEDPPVPERWTSEPTHAPAREPAPVRRSTRTNPPKPTTVTTPAPGSNDGSGSNVSRPVKWDKVIILPSDSGSNR